MKVTAKKCKGTGHAKGHGCDSIVLWRKYGLCKMCYSPFMLYTPEGNKIMERVTISAKKKVKREKSKETREQKEQNKSIAKLIQESRKPFQQWIRMRDANHGCISCSKVTDARDGSHYFKAEVYSGLIFDERNVHSSCKYCNKYLDGNLVEYRKGLVKRYGEDYVLGLEKDSIERRSYKYTREELNDIKHKYLKLLKL